MKVRATQLGYYGNIRIREGQAFRLKDQKHFSKEWMVKLDKKAKVEELVMEQPAPIESPLIQESEAEQVAADNNSDVI